MQPWSRVLCNSGTKQTYSHTGPGGTNPGPGVGMEWNGKPMTVSEYLLDHPDPIHFDWSSGSNVLSCDIVNFKARLWWDPDRNMKDGASREFPGCSGWGTDYSDKPILEFGIRNLTKEPTTYNPKTRQLINLTGSAYKWVSGDPALKDTILQQREGERVDPTNPSSAEISLSKGNVGILYAGQNVLAYSEDEAGEVTNWTRISSTSGISTIAASSAASCFYATYSGSILTIDTAANNSTPIFSLTGTTKHDALYKNNLVLDDNYYHVYIMPNLAKSAVTIASGYKPAGGGGVSFDTIITKDGDRWIAHNADGTVDILTRRSEYLSQFAYSTNPASPIKHLETGTPLARCVTADGVFWGRWNGFAYRDFRSEG